MRGVVVFFFTYLGVTFATALEKSPDVFQKIQKSIEKEVAAVKQPVEEGLVYVGSSQCSNVKKIIGVAYEQVKGEKEPDLNSLSIVYRTKAVTASINITAAAKILRQARDYDNTKRLIIFFHGYTDDPTKDSFGNISLSFFKTGESSILALDGSSLIKWLYLRSTTYIQFMGEKMGETLAELVEHGHDPSLIHIIGHSLGSHIAGFAGKTFHNLTGRLIGRISALDPAGPCFTHVEPELRLKYSDAEFVDVIHTDGGVFGISDPVGHQDYYPNSGKMQPDCFYQTCSHSRAWLLYGESVLNTEAFPAIRCNDWEAFKKGQCDSEISLMGYPAKPGKRGLYFLQTAGTYPFGLGREGLKYKNNEGFVKSVTGFLG